MAERHYSDAAVQALLTEYHQTGNPRLRDRVVEQMRPLVTAVARKFAGREPLEDLESEGYLGLIRAVDRYAPDRGTRFSTFATHLVAGQIRHYLRDRGHLIRQPAWLQELNSRVVRISAELEQRLQREPSVAEIAAAANISEEGVEELIAARLAAQVVRMEAPSEGSDSDFMDVDPEKFKSRDYVTLQLPIEDRIVLEAALDKLKDLEKKVLHYFFFQDFNQSEIARTLGISCNYTGYVLRNGLKHMRERLPSERSLDQLRAGTLDSTVMDPATGLYTRDHFENRLKEEVTRANRFGQQFSVCCLRIPANASESTLQAAAEILKKKTRKADIVARTGEREFGLIFPNTGGIAQQVAMRLSEQLYPAVRQTIHSAAVTYPEDGSTAQELFECARDGRLPSRPHAPTILSGPVNLARAAAV